MEEKAKLNLLEKYNLTDSEEKALVIDAVSAINRGENKFKVLHGLAFALTALRMNQELSDGAKDLLNYLNKPDINAELEKMDVVFVAE
ncbi:MAG: hypothetical protein SOH68_01810 [Lactobacillus sp.]|jgi:hypothetical protein|uniref:Bacteriocin immunity protein n=1 Tax=Lactobacillus porci TaxID=2012477 RepID=A0A6A8MEN6_9LACO|nr:hypothetical protein [Lactobacillus porci]MDD6416557.1 hypothetical protein [Lactobacillus porci]MDD6719419.1 hypothetical protein [Lactobacillus porci]MST87249.1 hypothetical protein [Lactobacillus porci]